MKKKTILDGDPGTGEGIAKVRREEALLQTEALQSAIFNSANFSSIATDAKGVIQIFNVGAERMLGYTAAEVLNKITPADLPDPQEVIARAQALSVEFGTTITPGFEALVFKASRGIEDIYELTYIRKDGSHFPAVVSVTALRDAQNAIIGYLLIGTDNTARKRAETELHIALEKYRVLFESFPLGISVTDAAGNLIEANRESERLLGIPRDEHARRKYDGPEWHIVRPDGTPMPPAEYASKRALREKRLVENVEMGIVKGGGGITWISVTAAPIPLEGYGVAIAYGDITERKRAEVALRQKAEALRASNAELEQFNRAMVGRELRMIELKQEINELSRRLGEPPRHETDQFQTGRIPGAGPAPVPPDGGGA